MLCLDSHFPRAGSAAVVSLGMIGVTIVVCRLSGRCAVVVGVSRRDSILQWLMES
jgi:hypothetical protein